MDWKRTTKLAALGSLLILLGGLFAGCGASNWSPTDPRLDTPDPSALEVVDRWEVTVNTEVSP